MSLLDAILLDPYKINVWIAYRTDGVAGTGTQNDPFNGSTAAKFDAIMNSLAANTTRLISRVRFRAVDSRPQPRISTVETSRCLLPAQNNPGRKLTVIPKETTNTGTDMSSGESPLGPDDEVTEIDRINGMYRIALCPSSLGILSILSEKSTAARSPDLL